MNKVLLQFWEESKRKDGVIPDGASLHIDISSYGEYIKDIYSNREIEIPNDYNRVIGPPIEVEANDDIYHMIISEKTVRLTQYQLNNLIKIKDIVIC